MSRRWIPVITVGVASAVFQPQVAQAAYIDPATSSYLIQIVSGLIITGSVAIGVFFRKIQLFFVTLGARLSALRVRLFTKAGRQARKAHQARQSRQSPSDTALANLRASALQAGRLAGATTTTTAAGATLSKRALLFGDARRWPARLGLAAMAAFLPAMVFVLYSVLTLFAGNHDQFPFTIRDLLPTTLGLFFGLGALMTLVLFLLRGRVLDLAISGLVGLALAGWLQSNLMNPEYGPLMGTPIPWQTYTKATVVNLAVWLLILAIVVGLRVASRKLWHVVVIGLSSLLLVGSAVSLVASYSKSPAGSPPPMVDTGYYSYDNAFTLSTTHNEIVFLVDTLDASLIDSIRQDDPHFFDDLTGFTDYAQDMSRYSQTDPGVPEMLTGQDFFYTTTYDAYKADAWRDASALRALKAAGYLINIYSDQYNTYAHDSDLVGLVDNFVVPATTDVNQLAMMKNMVKLASFVDAPIVAKPTFWMDGSEFATIRRPPAGRPAPYLIDDAGFYANLTAQGLTVRDAQPQFNYFHFEGSHAPFNLDAHGLHSDTDTDVITQTKGVFHIIFDYLDRMKQLGVYDQSTVVILGDHGTHVGPQARVLDHPILPGLWYKPVGPSTAPPTISLAPTSQENFLPTLVSQAGLDATAYGQPYDAVPLDSTEPRLYIWYRPKWGIDPSFGVRFEVTGDARDWANWQLIEQFPLIVD